MNDGEQSYIVPTPRWRHWALVIALGGCHRAPPIAPPPPPPPPPPPAAIVAPPPPKCELPEEACVARADTRARVPHIALQVTPPEGWTYAQGDAATIATGKNAAFGVTTHPTAEGKGERGAREESLELVTDKLGVTMARKKDVFWRNPDQRQKVGGVEVALYQVDGAKRDGKKGPLLVFVAKVEAGQTLVGAGFVSYDDTDNADRAILKAIDSLAPAWEAPAASKTAP